MGGAGGGLDPGRVRCPGPRRVAPLLGAVLRAARGVPAAGPGRCAADLHRGRGHVRLGAHRRRARVDDRHRPFRRLGPGQGHRREPRLHAAGRRRPGQGVPGPTMTTADAVVVGAGIAGVAAAHQLAVRRKVGKVVIVDPRPPLTLTSDKSTECYRNWWPSESMVGLMNRSIDLLEEFSEESNGVFGLSRRGYLFVTADLVKLAVMEAQADVITTFGAGAVRRHPGPVPYGDHADGVDILNQPDLAKHFPYLTPEAKGAVHVRRAGWFSAQQLGSWMLEESERNGAVRVVDTVTAIDVDGDRVRGVRLAGGDVIEAPVVVVAAGPMSREVGRLAGLELPLRSELHLKVALRDHLGVIPRDAPMLIWSDPQWIDWSEEERAGLAELGRDDLLGKMPGFCRGRPRLPAARRPPLSGGGDPGAHHDDPRPGGLPRPSARGPHRWRLLHEDRGEPAAHRACRARRPASDLWLQRIRGDGRLRRRRPARRPCRRGVTAGVRGRVPVEQV